MSGRHSMSRELDQVMSQYRDRLGQVAALWSQATQLRLCDVTMSKSTEQLVHQLEVTVTGVMEKEVKVEKSRQAVLDLGMVLDVSRQTVETKSKHLSLEESQKEEAQSVRFREFQKIHKLQAEKATIEREIIPVKAKLNQVIATLNEKNEKMRNLERFHSLLSSQCARDMLQLKDDTDLARQQRPTWDTMTDQELGTEVKCLELDKAEVKELASTVSHLHTELHNYRQWYEEEMQTKLFLSTRSKEIKHRLAHFRTILHRLEAGSEVTESESKERVLSRHSDNLMVDGCPGVQAKEVEQYLSQQLGMRVMADYTMLKRLKEEIGVQGLAYLVEKIRLQGGRQAASSSAPGHTGPSGPSGWEEKRLHQALLNIALEYREQDSSSRVWRVPGLAGLAGLPGLGVSTDSLSTDTSSRQGRAGRPVSPDSASRSSRESATAASDISNRRGSGGQLRRKNSLARIRKLLHF